MTHPESQPFIVTADDFGLNPAVNAAVLRSLAQGLVSHASVLVNLPGFEDVCEAARSAQLTCRLGLHLNLTEGKPLTDAIRATSLCWHGVFRPHDRFHRYKPLSGDTQRAVAGEVLAQIASARGQGIALTHLDSHNDVHTAPAIAAIVASVARSEGIQRVRPARNCGLRQGFVRWVQHRWFNVSLARQGLRQVTHFGTIDDMLWLARKGRLQPGSAEIMTHPLLDPSDVIVDAPSMKPLAERLLQLESQRYRRS
jgi:predicted glycoside hydrolase/deacetylase ChbG (UPF0249 family)